MFSKQKFHPSTYRLKRRSRGFHGLPIPVHNYVKNITFCTFSKEFLSNKLQRFKSIVPPYLICRQKHSCLATRDICTSSFLTRSVSNTQAQFQPPGGFHVARSATITYGRLLLPKSFCRKKQLVFSDKITR